MARRRPSPIRPPNNNRANAQPTSSPRPPAYNSSPRDQSLRRYNPDDLVQSTRLSLDADSDLVYIFETKAFRFGLIVQLRDISALGWKECQAVVDGMRVAAPGAPRTDRGFAQTLRSLEHKYGSARGPVQQPDGRLCGSFFPVRGSVNGTFSNGLASTGLSINESCIRVTAKTHSGHMYSVSIVMDPITDIPNESQVVRPDAMACRAFIDVMTVLEPGDIVDIATFRKFSRLLKKRYGNVQSNDGLDGEGTHVYHIDVRMTTTTSRQIPGVIDSPQSPTPESPMNPPGTSSSGITFPQYKNYQISRQLADSGQATVYEGIRESDGLRVAIKVFHGSSREEVGDYYRPTNSFGEDSTSSTTADAHEAYKTELRHLLKMNGHKNVVQVVDFFEIPKPALVMRFVQGQELGKWIHEHNGNPPPWDEALRLAIGIAEGICHLHKHGVVHRDLKSSNVMRKHNDGTPILIDLGLSSFVPNDCIAEGSPSGSSDNVLVTREVKGTYLYLSPEMIRRREWSDRTDVYAFGMVLWELCTGRLPFKDDLRRGEGRIQLMIKIADGARPRHPIPDSVPQYIRELIYKCWAQNPSDRPSINRVLDTLRGADDPMTVFNQHDLNRDGALGFAEFALFLEDYKRGRVPNALVYPLFEVIDENGDGKISYQEFERFWRQVEIAGYHSVLDRKREHKLVNVQHAAVTEVNGEESSLNNG